MNFHGTTHIVLLLLLLAKCYGQNKDKNVRIIAGKASPPGAHQFVASLQRRNIHMCGGSVISFHFVLTAAHCCVERNGSLMDKRLMTISVGNVRWKEGTMHNVQKFYLHQNYERKLTRNDIALVKSASTLIRNNNVSLVNLLSDWIDSNAYMTATVYGWGYTNDGDHLVKKPADQLNYVDLYILPSEVCKKTYSKFSDMNLCMSSVDKRGSCNGDSGGPLTVVLNSMYYQIGIVSFGGNCNNTKPEVYTRISSYYGWIQNTMQRSMKMLPKK